MPLVSQVAHDRDTMLLQKYHTIVINLIPVVSGHVLAMYLKWHMCPCHAPLVAQILIRPITLQSHTKGNHLITQNG